MKNNQVINEDEILKEIKKGIKEIEYGYIQIVIHDSKVVQIEKTKKVRFEEQKTK